MKSAFFQISKSVFDNTNRANALYSTLTSLVTTAINLFAPIVLVNNLSNQLSPTNEENNDQQNLIIVAAGLLVLARHLPAIRDFALGSIRANVQKELTFEMVKKTYALDYNKQVTDRTGAFAQALAKNYSSIDKVIPGFYGQILPFFFDVIAISVFMINEYGLVGALPLGTAISFQLVGGFLEKRALSIRKDCADESYRGYGAVIQSVQNYLIAHQHSNVDYELASLDKALQPSENKYRAMHHNDNKNALVLTFINTSGMFATLLIFMLQNNNNSSIRSSLLYAYFVFYLNNIMNALPSSFSSFYTGLTDAERVVSLLAQQPSIRDKESHLVLATNEPLEIEFQHVCFSYGPKPVLQDISFKIEAGKKVAVVGPTGAGKSTLLKLLTRFYEPSSGHILVNGKSIQHYSLASLRAHFAIVSQETGLSSGSVRSNIQYGDVNASAEDVEKAARFAGLTTNNDFLNQSVGAGGASVSGGEKQRTAVARSVLLYGSKYSVMYGRVGAVLLDEPTSALDLKTERQVLDTLEHVTADANLTMLTITHHLSTVTGVDKIYYLKNGTIVESGTFNELIKNKATEFSMQLETECKELGITLDDINVQENKQPLRLKKPSSNEIRAFWESRKPTKPIQIPVSSLESEGSLAQGLLN